MTSDPLDLYRRASEWTLSRVSGSVNKVDEATPCDQWDVRTLMNHMLETQQYFVASARGEDASPPSPQPPDLVGDDPVAALQRVRDDTLFTVLEEELGDTARAELWPRLIAVSPSLGEFRDQDDSTVSLFLLTRED